MNFDDILSATADRDEVKVLREENDFGNINVEAIDFDKRRDDALRGLSRTYEWDASEYGVSLEEAQRRILAADTPEGRAKVMEDMRQRALQRANLATTDGAIAMMSAGGETPWHQLGTVVSGYPDAKGMLRHAKLSGWNLQKVKNQIWNGSSWQESSGWSIVRTDTDPWTVISKQAVGDQYTIFDNEDMAWFADAVIEEGARFETAGATGKGETVWMLAKMPSRSTLNKDEIVHYAMFTTAHDGRGSVKAYGTSERVVCHNTLMQSLRDRCRGISFRHSKNAKANARKARESLGLISEKQAEYDTMADVLASQQLADPVDYFKYCLDDIVDVTVAGQDVTKDSIDGGQVLSAIMEISDVEERSKSEQSYQRAVQRRAGLLDDIMDRYETQRNGNKPGIEGSKWAAFNAVNEYANYGLRYRGGSQESRRFESLLDGRGADISDAALDRVAAL